jgi:hypothetical protein
MRTYRGITAIRALIGTRNIVHACSMGRIWVQGAQNWDILQRGCNDLAALCADTAASSTTGTVVGGQSPFAMTEELLDRASDAVEALDPDAYQRYISRVLMQYYDLSEEPAAFVDRMLTRADIRCTAAARARAIKRVAAFWRTTTTQRP